MTRHLLWVVQNFYKDVWLVESPYHHVPMTWTVWGIKFFLFTLLTRISPVFVFFSFSLCFPSLPCISGVMLDSDWGWGTTHPVTPSFHSIGRPKHCRSPPTNGCFPMAAPLLYSTDKFYFKPINYFISPEMCCTLFKTCCCCCFLCVFFLSHIFLPPFPKCPSSSYLLLASQLFFLRACSEEIENGFGGVHWRLLWWRGRPLSLQSLRAR